MVITNLNNEKILGLDEKRRSLSKFPAIYPTPIEISNLNKSDAKCGVNFNILPYRYVSEEIYVDKYIISKRYIKAYFSRKYKTDMVDSPDHLIFLTSLVHLQKMIYMYLCYEFGFSVSVSGKEKLKVWPTKINVKMKNLITQSSNISQSIKINSLRKTGERTFFGKCESTINGGEALITADAVIHII